MNRESIETVGVRYTGWAAIDRDPQEDVVEFTCPHCGQRGTKSARRARARYHFTDGFLQDLQGEASGAPSRPGALAHGTISPTASCRTCRAKRPPAGRAATRCASCRWLCCTTRTRSDASRPYSRPS